MSWKDIIKAKKINWQQFKRSLPDGTNLGSLNEKDRGESISVIFQSEALLNEWSAEYGDKFIGFFRPRLLSGGQLMLNIPRTRFDEYDTKSRLRTSITDDETYEFEDFENP